MPNLIVAEKLTEVRNEIKSRESQIAAHQARLAELREAEQDFLSILNPPSPAPPSPASPALPAPDLKIVPAAA
jgi:hypothetical protein